MKATDTFRTAPYLHNCAQAIAYKWRSRFADGQAVVARYAPYRGGMAPEGICGALYAAMQACPAHAEDIKREFAQTIGATHCRDIKGVHLTPCENCVATADALVERYSG